jgi:hypothetical protein
MVTSASPLKASYGLVIENGGAGVRLKVGRRGQLLDASPPAPQVAPRSRSERLPLRQTAPSRPCADTCARGARVAPG